MAAPLQEVQFRRKKLNLTQTDLARESGVSQSMIAKIEAGRLSPTYDKARQIFEALDRLEKKEEVKAYEIMTKNPVIVQINDKIGTAIDSMKRKGISHLPVIDGKQVVGTVSEGMVLENIDTPNLADNKVSTIMDDSPPTIPEETPISLVSEMLRYHSIILVTKKAEISGVITKSNLLDVVR